MAKAKAYADPQHQLNQLADYLRMRRETMLNQWRTRCSQDLKLSSYSSFSREEFNDQAPVLLNILEQRLRAQAEESGPVDRAREHGLHRWQRGYTLPELLAELEHLYWILLDEVQAYHKQQPLPADRLGEAYRQVFLISAETSRGSVLYYDQLRQTNAAQQANVMQHALEQLQHMGKQQGEHLRQSSHDLRSSFGILMGTANLLTLPGTKEERALYIDMLNRNLVSLHGMLLQLTDFARAEAGQDPVDSKEFDVAALLRENIALAQPLAQERGLVLQGEGPDTLVIQSDAVKIQRILHNLLSNALKYTRAGGVNVSWAQENDTRWILSVQDTGRGFAADSPPGLLAEQLRPLGQPSGTHQTGGPEEYPLEEPPSTEPLKKSLAAYQKESEGLGLFIVKKLCELLKASVDIESAVDQGTLVRIRFLSR